MDFSDLLVTVLVIVGVVFLIGCAIVACVAWKYRVPPRGIAAMIGALVYLASPIDVIPEAIAGPLGLVDDAGVATVVAVWVFRLVKARQMLKEAGVGTRRSG